MVTFAILDTMPSLIRDYKEGKVQKIKSISTSVKGPSSGNATKHLQDSDIKQYLGTYFSVYEV